MTREEAIEVYNGLLNQKIKEAFEFFAPELRESEDERIRKELVSIVKAYRENCIDEGNHRFDDCLDWLEKQKEISMPNSTELIEMWNEEKAMLNEKDFRGDKWRLAYNAFMDGFARGICVKFKKQKEQKPVPISCGNENGMFDMKEPDLIYVSIDTPMEKRRSPEFVGLAWSERDNSCEHVEYIRKDALLDRIKERLKLYDPNDPEEETVCYELQSIIRYLNEKEEENESSNTQNRENRRSIGC